MIHKIKTITYEVRSHGRITRLSENGIVIQTKWHTDYQLWSDNRNENKTIIKKILWHLEDVLKCMKQIEKEREAKKTEIYCALDPAMPGKDFSGVIIRTGAVIKQARKEKTEASNREQEK